MPGARLHVFIIGVSEYPNLPDPSAPMLPTAYGMRKLSSPAISAFRLYEWIRGIPGAANSHLPLPLGHCSLLLSPSLAECIAEPKLDAARAAGEFQDCSLQNVIDAADAWRNAASNNKDDITWFYFAGHGVEKSKNDAVMLLEGFGQACGGALVHAIDLNSLVNGMAPTSTRQNIARTQVYFMDACRITPVEFQRLQALQPTQVFNVELGGRDDRDAPIFLASVSGDSAAGFAGKPSLFNELLRQCLAGKACGPAQNGNGAWNVTSNNLIDAMNILLADYNSRYRIDQMFSVGGSWTRNVVICPSQVRPPVNITMSVEPEAALPFVSMRLVDVEAQQQVLNFPLHTNRHEATVSAGCYLVQALAVPHPTYQTRQPFVELILPPRRDLIGRV